MAVANLTSHGWIIDHGGTISHCEIVARSNDMLAVRCGQRLLLVARQDCFPSEAAAVQQRMKVVSDEIAVRQRQWADLAAKLNPSMEAS